MSLKLKETAKLLTYTGTGTSAGLTLVIVKDNALLDVHQVVPAAMANMTWQQLRDSLANRLDS